jgi:hypothetical protein
MSGARYGCHVPMTALRICLRTCSGVSAPSAARRDLRECHRLPRLGLGQSPDVPPAAAGSLPPRAESSATAGNSGIPNPVRRALSAHGTHTGSRDKQSRPNAVHSLGWLTHRKPVPSAPAPQAKGGQERVLHTLTNQIMRLRLQPAATPAPPTAEAGRSIRNTVRMPGADSQTMVPPCASTARFTMESPSPVPFT